MQCGVPVRSIDTCPYDVNDHLPTHCIENSVAYREGISFLEEGLENVVLELESAPCGFTMSTLHNQLYEA
jgi:hypothetical protein